MRAQNEMPGKIAEDIEQIRKICDLIGGLSYEDKRLVCWITAADCAQLEDTEIEKHNLQFTEKQQDSQ